MGRQFRGYSSYVILIHDNQLGMLEERVGRYNDFMDIVAKYDKEGYWFVQIDVMDYQRSNQELSYFVFNVLPYIAIKEESSTFIIARDKETYKKAVNTLYTEDEKDLLLYDMLSIGDRYDALAKEADVDPMYADEIRLIYDAYGSEYSLLFERECKYLFSEDTMVTILDEMTWVKSIVDILDCMDIFKFHIVILRAKS